MQLAHVAGFVRDNSFPSPNRYWYLPHQQVLWARDEGWRTKLCCKYL